MGILMEFVQMPTINAL